MEALLDLINVSEIIAAVVGALVTAAVFGVKYVFGKVDEYIAGTPNTWDDEAWAKFKEAVKKAVNDAG